MYHLFLADPLLKLSYVRSYSAQNNDTQYDAAFPSSCHRPHLRQSILIALLLHQSFITTTNMRPGVVNIANIHQTFSLPNGHNILEQYYHDPAPALELHGFHCDWMMDDDQGFMVLAITILSLGSSPL
jgi:hypothetical protein